MSVSVEVDEGLVAQAMKIGKFGFKKEAVHAALKEYLARHGQAGILELFGKVEYDQGYDYKKLRSRKRV